MLHGTLGRGTVAAVAGLALGLAGLTACASTTQSVGVGAPGTVSSSLSPSVGGSPSANPGGPKQPAPAASPNAQVDVIPTGSKLVAIGQLNTSADGRTLYLEIQAQGGACGKYDAVLQETSGQVRVGLAHLPVKVGVMCPMLVRTVNIPVTLSSPLGGRTVIDLATGKAITPSGVISAPLPVSPAA